MGPKTKALVASKTRPVIPTKNGPLTKRPNDQKTSTLTPVRVKSQGQSGTALLSPPLKRVKLPAQQPPQSRLQDDNDDKDVNRNHNIPPFDPKQPIANQVVRWLSLFIDSANGGSLACQSWTIPTHYPYPSYPNCFSCGMPTQQIGQLYTDFRKHHFDRQQSALMIRHLYRSTHGIALRSCCQRMILPNLDVTDEQYTYANIAARSNYTDYELLKAKNPEQFDAQSLVHGPPTAAPPLTSFSAASAPNK